MVHLFFSRPKQVYKLLSQKSISTFPMSKFPFVLASFFLSSLTVSANAQTKAPSEQFVSPFPCIEVQAKHVSKKGSSYTCYGSKKLADILIGMKENRSIPVKERLKNPGRPNDLRKIAYGKHCIDLGPTWRYLQDSVDYGKSICYDSSKPNHQAYATYRKRRSKAILSGPNQSPRTNTLRRSSRVTVTERTTKRGNTTTRTYTYTYD